MPDTLKEILSDHSKECGSDHSQVAAAERLHRCAAKNAESSDWPEEIDPEPHRC